MLQFLSILPVTQAFICLLVGWALDIAWAEALVENDAVAIAIPATAISVLIGLFIINSSLSDNFDQQQSNARMNNKFHKFLI